MSYRAVGTWVQICHWGPILALSVICLISSVAVLCDLMWWPPTTVGGVLHLALFLFWVSATLYNYFSAAFKGPGFAPFQWKPKIEEECKYLQYCEYCQGFKPPRSHHCRKCNRCVMKMDHHCPWINTCCGHLNHGNFVWFLFFAPCGCIHAVAILICTLYRAINIHYYYHYHRHLPLVELGVAGFIVTMFATGLAIGVVVAVGMLLFIQMKSILKNETGIESWIITKAKDRMEDEEEEGEFIYPYHLGWRRNLAQVFTRSGRPLSDGITWEVVEGCNQYSLTVEQLKQKAEKRERTVMYCAEKPYSGSLCPVSMGPRVYCCIPCTDEPRTQLQKGDYILVTRWRRHWLYGTKIAEKNTDANGHIPGPVRMRGWFPRRCVREVVDNNMNKKDL